MDQFMGLISVVLKQMRSDAELGMAHKNLSFPEQMVLMCVKPDQVCNQDTIAKTLGFDKGTTARTIAKLEEKGLIQRSVNPSNRRENLVSLLPAGKKTLEEMAANLQSFDAKAFEGFSAEERRQFMDALIKIATNLRGE